MAALSAINAYTSFPGNIFLKDMAVIFSPWISESKMERNNSATPGRKLSSTTPNENLHRTTRKSARKAKSNSEQPNQGKQVQGCSQTLLYECPNCRSLSSGHVRVEKAKHKKRWRFIIYGIDPMPIPPPAPQLDSPPTSTASASQPLVTQKPAASNIMKISNQHLAYPAQNPLLSHGRRPKHINTPLHLRLASSTATNLNASWLSSSPAVSSNLPANASSIEGGGTTAADTTNPPLEPKMTRKTLPCVVIPSATLPSGDQGRSTSSPAPAHIRPSPNTKTPSPRKKRGRRNSGGAPKERTPQTLEHVVDFQAFLRAARAVGIYIPITPRRSISAPLKKKKPRGSFKCQHGSEKQLSNVSTEEPRSAEVKPKEAGSGEIKSPGKKKHRHMKHKRPNSRLEKLSDENETVQDSASDTGRLRKPLYSTLGKVSMIDGRPISSESIAFLIHKCRQLEKEKYDFITKTRPQARCFASPGKHRLEESDDSSSSTRLLTSSIEAVKIAERSSPVRKRRNRIKKASTLREAAEPAPTVTLANVRDERPGSDGKKSPVKDPETLLEEFRARLKRVQGKGHIKASHIEVMAYLEGKKAGAKSFSCLPQTYQQMGLPPLRRNPSSENVLLSDMKFTCALDDTQAKGEPNTPRKRKRSVRRKASVKSLNTEKGETKSHIEKSQTEMVRKIQRSVLSKETPLPKTVRKDLSKTQSSVKRKQQ